MTDLLLWDCGTQVDLADIDGLLYVPAAHSIRPRFAWLADEARKRNVPRLCSIVTHRDGDADITTGKPDYKTTFPVHCLEGTPGWAQIPESACRRAVTIPRDPHAGRPIRESLKAGAPGGSEIAVESAGWDPFANPALGLVLDELAPRRCAVFGVPCDRLVVAAVEGLLAKGGIAVSVVEDAVKPFDTKLWDAARAGWAEKGVTFVAHRALFP